MYRSARPMLGNLVPGLASPRRFMHLFGRWARQNYVGLSALLNWQSSAFVRHSELRLQAAIALQGERGHTPWRAALSIAARMAQKRSSSSARQLEPVCVNM